MKIRILSLAAILLCALVSAAAQGQERLVPIDEQGRTSYIVTFSERGLLDIHRSRGADARSFDFQSAAVTEAREQMQRQQSEALRNIASRIGRSLEPTHHYLVSSNGMALRLTPEEAKQVAALPSVDSIRRDRLYDLDTYRGPSFIGADTIWDGTNTPDGSSLRGEGVVIAILDSGIPNLGDNHASFINDPACGHGSSQPDKVLSSLDCETTDGSGLCNGPSPGDTNGHGSHTASTAGGNLIDSSASPSPTVPGGYTEMSGVAHCASIRSYKVCPGSSCPGAAIQAGMDSVLIHGDVSAMNFSISGGRSPWTDNDRRKLDIVDSGVFVAASAGNTSLFVTDPVGEVNHLGPWVMSVAASTRDTNNSGTSAQGDVLANFSLRGPTPAPYDDLQKPNITAPGVDIYAAVPGGYNFLSGTSMSSPHTAGAGALVAQANPSWTAMEIKSALQMTSFDGGFKEGGTTPWDPDDVGSGRVDLTQAALAGLVMDESAANFLAADPNSGGDLKTLNLPSMRNLDCTPSCTFTRTVRNTLTTASSWTASGASNGGEFSVDVSPATFAFTGDTSETQTLTITVTAQSDTTGSIAFGGVTLSEDGGLAPDARMTIAMSGVGGPDIAVSPADFSFNLQSGSTDSGTLQIDSTGTQALDWTIDEATPDSVVLNPKARNRGVLPAQEVLNIPNFTVNPSTPVDFDITAGVTNPGDVTGFRFDGEVTSIGSADWASDMIMNVTSPASDTYSVGGFDNPTNDWDFQGSGSTDPGVYDSTHNDIFGAGGTPDAGDWNFEFIHDYSSGTDMTWENVTITLFKQVNVCQNITEITWLSVDTTSGSIPAGNSQNVQVSVDATGLGAGTYEAQLCLNSNAASQPIVQIPVTLEVTDPPDPTEATLNGTVSSLGYCDSATSAVGGANVEVVGQSNTYNVTTGGSGAYSINIPASESPVTINVAPADHLPGSVTNLDIVAENTYTNDFDLRLDAPCATASDTPISVTLDAGQTTSQSLTLNNGGAGALNWSADFDNVQGAGQPVETVADGGFEAGTPNPEWDETSTNFGTPLCDVATCGGTGGGTGAFAGDWWAWFGGVDEAEDGTVAQTVTIPDNAVAATLSFFLEIPTADVAGSFEVSLGGDVLFSATDADTGTYATYQEVTVDVSAYADGTPNELLFSASTVDDGTAETVTNFFVDNVSLVATVPIPCENLPGLTWLSASPASGTVAADDSEDISLDFDASVVGEGAYSGSVCLASDDTENALIVVPVNMTVEGQGGGIFSDRFESL
jgi:subtilisin family serine protease